MLGDWILGLRDRELLFKKLVELANSVDEKARCYAGTLCAGAKTCLGCIRWLFLAAVATTVVAGLIWVFCLFASVSAAWPYQLALTLFGGSWAILLVAVAVLAGIVTALVRLIPGANAVLDSVEREVKSLLRIPAAFALVCLFMAVTVGTFPNLRSPQGLVTLFAIAVVLGLGAFLGHLRWLRNFVGLFLVLAVLLLLVPFLPQSVLALGERAGRNTDTAIALAAGSKSRDIDPDNPPPFFNPVNGKPLFWYSADKDGRFSLWDGPGPDPNTGAQLKPVRDWQMREEILSQLRARKKAKFHNPASAESGPAAPRENPPTPADNATFLTSSAPRLAFSEPTSVNLRAVPVFDVKKFEEEQAVKIGNGSVPPLIASASRLSSPGRWRLFLKNNGERKLDILLLKMTVNGVERTAGFTKTLLPKEQEFIGYDEDFQFGDKMDIFCEGFKEPFRLFFQ
jgi:hypothetical protein